jgi:invasion protein IalB
MHALLKSGAMAGLLALSASYALGQDTPAATPAPPPTLETAAVGDVYLAETSEPWELRCTKIETGQGPCQIFQLLKDESGGDVAEYNMFEIPDGESAAAGAVVVVPLETLLETGLIVKTDDQDPRGYGFHSCNSYGCIARIGFTTEELAAMKSGKQTVLTIVPALAPDVKVNLTLSLKGFTAMLEKTKPTK